MEHFQAALDPRKQELLEARFLGAKVSLLPLIIDRLFSHTVSMQPYSFRFNAKLIFPW